VVAPGPGPGVRARGRGPDAHGELRAGLALGERGQRLDDELYRPDREGLSLVSIVVGGVTFAFGEGGSKRLLAGIVFGVGMAIGAVNFMAWLFP
jgi:hypothetical protein